MLSFCGSAEALRLQSEAFRGKHGRPSAQLEELRNSLEQRNGVAGGQRGEAEPRGGYLRARRRVAELAEFTQAAEEKEARRHSLSFQLWNQTKFISKSWSGA